ncbi:NADP-dependent oxidoreductase [Rosenbergiella epipactidis]|uniref:NADP-dependent oxidoreductase n=1 Tax=Rosenbergiella epipactidis TaxID=1544694 RepID=UPI001F4E8762|nr:NADP-dependent oxidoreductase [Rosenbergiella epipactidis]
MSTAAQTYQGWQLSQRPNGEPTEQSFAWVTGERPTPQPGELLLRTEYLSLDPYMRGRMDDSESYAPPVQLGDVMVGGTVSRVVHSTVEGFAEGDWVLSQGGWQNYSLAKPQEVVKLDQAMAHPSYALGILGMPGFTAYMGLTDIGKPQPGETLVVAAATGPVGATVGQLGKRFGCHVVGVAGGAEKCRHAMEVLGFDHCIDHHAQDFEQQLASACPKGIDIYFENVGGKVFEAVFPRLNPRARVPVCGAVSYYNHADLPDGPDKTPYILTQLIKKRILLQGFIIFADYADHYSDFLTTMTPWVENGEIHYREQVIEGLEQAPSALNKVLRGENFGKVVIKVQS